MYERFTDRARKVYQLANQEAQRYNHDKVDVFHILIALVKEDHGVAANVLKNLDVDLRKLRLEVDKHVVAGPDLLTMGKLPHTEAASCIAPLAVNEAAALGHNYVGTEHVLLGILREEFTGIPGIAGKVLLGLGLDAKKVRDEIKAVITPSCPTTEHNVTNPLSHYFPLKTPAIDTTGATFLVKNPDITDTSPTVYTNPNQCCFIDIKTMLQCQNRATFWIGTDGVDNYTHSCEEHVKDLRQDGDVVRAFASSGPSSNVGGLMRDDPVFKAIINEVEYARLEDFKKLLTQNILSRVRDRDLLQAERSLLVHFCEMLTMYGYAITKTQRDDKGNIIGVDMAAGRDYTAYVWQFSPATCGPEELKQQEEVRALAEKYARDSVNRVHVTIPDCKQPQGSSSVKYATIKDWCERVGLDIRGNSDGGETKEAIRKEMMSTVVENVKHFKHALTVNELIDVEPLIRVEPISEKTATFINEMADAVEQTTCTCKSLLNGHSNGCPFATK